MLEALSFPFMQRALLGGVLIAFLASYYGVFLVQRGLGFFGNGLAHAAFGGVALGLLLEAEPLWIAVPFTILVSLGITWIQQQSRLRGDTAIGVFFAVSMALGVIFLSLKERYTADAYTYIFGSILAVRSTDLWVTGLAALGSVLTWPLWGRWAYATFDRDLALAGRLPVARDDYLLSALIAATVVVSVKMVGIVLMSAFLVIPAAAARLLARSFAWMTLVSIAIGVSSAIAGLWVSYLFDLPSGASIVMTQAVVFFAALAFPKRG